MLRIMMENSRCLKEPRRPVDDVIDDDGDLDGGTLVGELVRAACHKVGLLNLQAEKFSRIVEQKSRQYEGLKAVAREQQSQKGNCKRGESATSPISPVLAGYIIPVV